MISLNYFGWVGIYTIDGTCATQSQKNLVLSENAENLEDIFAKKLSI